MLFTSGLFLFCFLPVTLLGFFALARFVSVGVAAAWVAFASILFYGYWTPAYVVLLLGSIALNYAGGIVIARSLAVRGQARLLLALFVAADLLLLAYFKYYNFFADSLRAAALPVPLLNVVLPIGISFFTFTQIAFLVDTAQGKVREFRPVHYVLFVTYFPHLIAGPILHHAEMMPQFADRTTYRPQLRNFAIGLAFLVIGMAKKVLIADSISPLADAAFAAARAGTLTSVHAWSGALAYTFQIYFDFSGYSDMAVGIALLMGIKLPYNFNSPYKSLSISDFWRRWHMTLSRFLRDYLYIGLGGNRRGKGRRYVNLFLTMLLGGLWHGAAWTFVIWGALHGGYLIVNHAFRWARERSGITIETGLAGRFAAWLLTMLAVVIGWVFFRAASVAEAMAMLRAMFGMSPRPAAPALIAGNHALLLILLAVATLLPNSQQFVMGRGAAVIDGLRSRSGGAILIAASLGAACVVLTWLAFVSYSRATNAFIYFNF